MPAEDKAGAPQAAIEVKGSRRGERCVHRTIRVRPERSQQAKRWRQAFYAPSPPSSSITSSSSYVRIAPARSQEERAEGGG